MHRVPIPAFFDDFVIPVLTDSPTELQEKTRSALAATACSFAERGMTINDAKGKTDILMFYNGKGSGAFHAFQQAATSLTASGPFFATLTIGVVESYRHLGTINAGGRVFDFEIQSRCAQAEAAYKHLSKNVYRNPLIPLQLLEFILTRFP